MHDRLAVQIAVYKEGSSGKAGSQEKMAAQFGLGNVCPVFASKLAGQAHQCRNFVQQARGKSELRIKNVVYMKAASATMANKSLKLTNRLVFH